MHPSAPSALSTFGLLLSVLAVGAGCGGAPGTPATAPAAAPAAASPGPSSAGPASAPSSLADGVYTEAQAQAGRQVWSETCSECHATSEMRGTDFMFEWEGSSVGRLYRVLTTTMPDDAPGSLPDAQYLAVVTYILQLNDFPAGDHPLTAERERLDALRISR